MQPNQSRNYHWQQHNRVVGEYLERISGRYQDCSWKEEVSPDFSNPSVEDWRVLVPCRRRTDLSACWHGVFWHSVWEVLLLDQVEDYIGRSFEYHLELDRSRSSTHGWYSSVLSYVAKSTTSVLVSGPSSWGERLDVFLQWLFFAQIRFDVCQSVTTVKS